MPCHCSGTCPRWPLKDIATEQTTSTRANLFTAAIALLSESSKSAAGPKNARMVPL